MRVRKDLAIRVTVDVTQKEGEEGEDGATADGGFTFGGTGPAVSEETNSEALQLALQAATALGINCTWSLQCLSF